jgi:hypothetical protein
MKMNTEARSQKPEARSSDSDLQPSLFRHPPPATLAAPQRSAGGRHSQNGVALIITLILLSVVTFMAVTFLALSRRERGAVATVTDTAGARYAADAALANAEAQIIANVFASTNPYNFSLLVSTNFINYGGFDPGVTVFDATNVNYEHLLNSSATLNQSQFLQNLANLYLSPRAPVFIPTNSIGSNDFRFYLDLNRNGQFDANGMVLVISPDPADPYYDNNGKPMLNIIPGNTLSNMMVGDPEWIGVLQRPDAPYGPNNPFVARYAFIALPIGNTLDLNAIHNNARRSDQVSADDGFLRNQGVGSWEINLAAFLADLNTNQWFQNPLTLSSYYDYEPTYISGPLAQYRSFDDALSLLNYRYGGGYTNLASVDGLFGPFPSPGDVAFRHDNIDGYSDGQLQTTFNTNADFIADDPTLHWAGAENTNHFFTHQELFNPNESSILFPNRLSSAGTNVSTYDRYTFYRLLSQLGTDSTPDSGKMNLNYDNLDSFVTSVAGVNFTNAPASTNFMVWTPIAFFTNAADRLLRAYTTQWRNSNPTNFAINFYTSHAFTNGNFTADQWTNYPAFGLSGAPGVIPGIPVLVSNQFVYSSAVNRLLQLAANMYDATTNHIFFGATTYPFLPSVFKPVFSVTNGNVYITNFVEVTDTSFLVIPQLNLGFGSNVVAKLALNPNDLVYGVPLIIGAKKGFPNFNEFALESVFQLTRKLQVTRANTNSGASSGVSGQSYQVNQMFNLSINNQLGVDFWNSYTNNYTRPVAIYVTNYLFLTLTNDEKFATNMVWTLSGFAQIPPLPVWAASSMSSSFITPMYTNLTVVTNSTYIFNTGGIPFLTNPPAASFESNVVIVVNGSSYHYPQPHWVMSLTNLIQAFMVDTASGRIIDYVQLGGPNSTRDLSIEILTNYDSPGGIGYDDLWDTNPPSGQPNGVPAGVANQIGVSLGNFGLTSAKPVGSWLPGGTAESEIDGFRVFFIGPNAAKYFPSSLYGLDATTNSHQVPFTPTATVVQQITWQANDPLVHYLASDLNWSGANTFGITPSSLTNGSLGYLNQRYMPWNGYPGVEPNTNAADFNAANAWNMKLKDPQVVTSDSWDFPTNKFPSAGWLGRVHRGTPWQTVYLKASDVLGETNTLGKNIGTNTWMTWTGNLNTNDAVNAAPVQDRRLFDLFTTAFNDNATRGTLSVNVGPTNANLAAWSALFSGIVVPTNLVVGYTIVNPAGVAGANSPLGQLVNGINQTRANTNLFPLQAFAHVGDILATPQLTEQSPFLAGLDPNTQISDEMYEWLPQQTMSLLRCSSSPRYVIYCYGQALKPAPNSIYTGSGPFFGMITNYQVVSEIATRAVVRFGSTLTNVITGTNYVVAGITNWSWFSAPVVTNNNAVIESFNLLPPD